MTTSTIARAAIVTRGLRKVYPAPQSSKRGGGPPPGPMARPAGPPNAGARAEVVALDSLDLEIGEGEFFGLLGPNGAGKTTTLGILTTRVLPTAGTALVADADVAREAVRVRQLIGVVPQRPNPDRSLTVLENLVFHAAYFGIRDRVATERAMRLLEQLGIADKVRNKVDELSGGQQQRLMIARALIHEPQVVFLDEPTVGLDPQARLALWDVLRELHAQGRTIVMTTHYMEEADRLCDRLAIIDHGRLLALDTPAALKARAPGGTLIRITLDGDPSPLIERARATPSVTRVDVAGAVLSVYAERAGEAIAALLKVVDEGGRTVTDIQLVPPSLESLFISLTGRRLD
jgi:ABC-2 type transport system ATP-binding protein